MIAINFLFLCLISQTSAYQAFTISKKAHNVVSYSKYDSSRKAIPALISTASFLQTPLLLSSARALIAVPTLYSLMSINEYITHRYYQHTDFNKNKIMQSVAKFLLNTKNKAVKIRGGGHVEHHAETLDDMSLRTDENWKKSNSAKVLDHDVYRGTAFTWTATFLMTIQMLPSFLPIFMLLLKFSLLQSISFLIPAMLLHGVIWNTIHPNMHGLANVPASIGPPSHVLPWLSGSSYFKYIYRYHELHHIVGGNGNYNVCCPLTDHLFGTFVPEKKLAL